MKETKTRDFRKFVLEYRIEIIALFIAILGMLLLVDPFGIRSALRATLGGLVTSVVEIAKMIVAGLVAYVRSITMIDLLVWGVLILAVCFVVWRVRYRILRSDLWHAATCPKCSSELKRVHRSSLDRFLSRKILPHARRYRCANKQCNWTGLRHRQASDRRRQYQEASRNETLV